MANYADDSPLGKQIAASAVYAPDVLFPIARQQARESLGLQPETLPFNGSDVWTAYEVSWLDEQGKPQVAVAEVTIPCDSPYLVESKSFKLYLNSLNNTRLKDVAAVTSLIAADLASCLTVDIDVQLYSLAEYDSRGVVNFSGNCLDELPVAVSEQVADSALLTFASQQEVSDEIYTDLFRSLCPVTGQPDWASVYIKYTGQQIDRASMLSYLVSYREHQGFHEQCVEQIYLDILKLARPSELTVYARFVRRGGLDINPYRTSSSEKPAILRLARQ